MHRRVGRRIHGQSINGRCMGVETREAHESTKSPGYTALRPLTCQAVRAKRERERERGSRKVNNSGHSLCFILRRLVYAWSLRRADHGHRECHSRPYSTAEVTTTTPSRTRRERKTTNGGESFPNCCPIDGTLLATARCTNTPTSWLAAHLYRSVLTHESPAPLHSPPQAGVVSKWLAVHLTGRDSLAGSRSLSLARPNDKVSESFGHSYCSSGDGRLPSPMGSNKTLRTRNTSSPGRLLIRLLALASSAASLLFQSPHATTRWHYPSAQSDGRPGLPVFLK